MRIVHFFICLTFIWLATVSSHAKESKFKTEFEPVEVVIWNREITTFRSTFAGLGPEGRAQRAAERINALPLDILMGEISNTEVTLGGQVGLILQLDGRTLLGLTPDDVDGTEKSALLQAAELAKERLREVFAARFEQANPQIILTGILYTALAVLMLILALLTVGRLH